jgi:hypothetical protein
MLVPRQMVVDRIMSMSTSTSGSSPSLQPSVFSSASSLPASPPSCRQVSDEDNIHVASIEVLPVGLAAAWQSSLYRLAKTFMSSGPPPISLASGSTGTSVGLRPAGGDATSTSSTPPSLRDQFDYVLSSVVSTDPGEGGLVPNPPNAPRKADIDATKVRPGRQFRHSFDPDAPVADR